MASILKVDSLTGVTTAGSISVTGEGNSTTTNLQQGLCKTWLSYNHDTPAVRDSFNVASVTDAATGQFRPSYSNNMASVNYAAYGTAQNSGTVRLATGSDIYSTSASDYFVRYNNSGTDTAYDYDKVTAAVNGDLA